MQSTASASTPPLIDFVPAGTVSVNSVALGRRSISAWYFKGEGFRAKPWPRARHGWFDLERHIRFSEIAQRTKRNHRLIERHADERRNWDIPFGGESNTFSGPASSTPINWFCLERRERRFNHIARARWWRKFRRQVERCLLGRIKRQRGKRARVGTSSGDNGSPFVAGME